MEAGVAGNGYEDEQIEAESDDGEYEIDESCQHVLGYIQVQRSFGALTSILLCSSPFSSLHAFLFFLVLAFLNLSFLLLRSLRQACASIEFRPFWRGKEGRDDVRKCEVNEAMRQ